MPPERRSAVRPPSTVTGRLSQESLTGTSLQLDVVDCNDLAARDGSEDIAWMLESVPAMALRAAALLPSSWLGNSPRVLSVCLRNVNSLSRRWEDAPAWKAVVSHATPRA